MFMDILDSSLDTWVYNEGHPRAFNGMRLKEQDEIQRLIEKNHCKWAVFKPLCDSHRIDRILSFHPGAQAIWIYRRYADVANSAVYHFGDHQFSMIRDIATNSIEKHWFGERLTADSLVILKNCFEKKPSFYEAAALKWYLHNKFLFDFMAVDKSMPASVLVIKYEDIVTYPEKFIPRIFDRHGIGFSKKIFTFIYKTAVSKSPPPPMNENLRELCEKMAARLDRAYFGQRTLFFDA